MSDDTSLGKVLTSYEAASGNPTNLDQQFGSDYYFTGLKVTIVPNTEVAPHRPTSTQLVPILHTTINNAVDSNNNGPALVRNQYARIPEITHGQLEGEAEVVKLNILQNITLDTADAKDLLVEEQLIVGTSRDTNANILKVTLDCDESGNPRNPTINVNKAPVIIDNVPTGKAPITVNVNSTPVTIKAPSSDSNATVLSVEGSAEVKKGLTVTNNTSTGTLSVDTNAFVVDTSGTTIKKNLAVKKDADTVFSINATDGNTVIAGTLDVAKDFTINPGADENTLKFKVDVEGNNTTVAGTLDVTGSATIKNNLIIKDTTGSTEKETFTVESSSGNTTIAGTLSVGPNGEGETPYLNITIPEGTGSLTEVNTDSFNAKSITGESLMVTGDLSTGNISSTLKEDSRETVIIGDLTVKDSSDNTKFKVEDAKTTIATSTTEVSGNLNVNSDKFKVTAKNGNTTVAGTLNVTGDSVNLVGDTVKIEKSGEPEVKSVTINGDTQITKTLTITDTSDTAIDITNGGLSVKGTITSKGALKVSEAAAVQALKIKSIPVIDSNRNLTNINNASVNMLQITANGVPAQQAALACGGNLIAKSVTANTLYVPNCNEKGEFQDSHTTLSLGPALVEEGEESVSSAKSFYLNGVEYTTTPTAATTTLINLIYPVGSIYMTIEPNNPAELFKGTT